MIEPQLAPVRPRSCLTTSSELPLDDEVRRFVDAGAVGAIAIFGPPGSGKTTALRHLAATFPTGVTLLNSDEAERVDIPDLTGLVVYAAERKRKIRHLQVYRLAPWTEDELIEYLLARHHGKCGSVMKRIRPADRVTLGGVPELWAIILDEFAADESLPDAPAALRRSLERQLPDTDVVQRSWNACLSLLTATDDPPAPAPPGFPASLTRVQRHRVAQVMLAADRIIADLRGDEPCDFLGCRLPRELVRAVARVLPPSGREVERLKEFMAREPWSQAMAASLLHALGRGWVPQGPRVPRLAGAYLNGIVWPNATLPRAELELTDFCGADLRGAMLNGATARRARFRRARLPGTSLNDFRAIGADFSAAILSGASGEEARFDYADFSGADLTEAELPWVRFRKAKLNDANFAGAKLTDANLRGATVQDTVFVGADLTGATLIGLKLRHADCRDACLARADLRGADLEDLDLGCACFGQANLTRSLLTGTRLRDADLTGARLRRAGLGDVDWENCCLRHADFTNASFHMGSSRSGLLFTTIASEGTRTGFYTDDYDERHFKSPEEIRKANLCGCDLRGAQVFATDFYLVDLRGAKYDPSQEAHFRKCGAILGRWETRSD